MLIVLVELAQTLLHKLEKEEAITIPVNSATDEESVAEHAESTSYEANTDPTEQEISGEQ